MYKLFNNCIYGKSIENPRKKINVKLLNDKKKYQNIVNKPDFISQKIIDKNLVYEQCFKDKELFDLSGYSKHSVYFDASNKKKLGKMKDEFNGNRIDEFIGLKSKMYSLISNDWEINKAKGVNLMLKHKEYVNVLFNKNVLRHKKKGILSEKHDIGSYVINKISLSCFDDKRFILDDGINSLAYGNTNIDKIR